MASSRLRARTRIGLATLNRAHSVESLNVRHYVEVRCFLSLEIYRCRRRWLKNQTPTCGSEAGHIRSWPHQKLHISESVTFNQKLGLGGGWGEGWGGRIASGKPGHRRPLVACFGISRLLVCEFPVSGSAVLIFLFWFRIQLWFPIYAVLFSDFSVDRRNPRMTADQTLAHVTKCAALPPTPKSDL